MKTIYLMIYDKIIFLSNNRYLKVKTFDKQNILKFKEIIIKIIISDFFLL